jgi:hypothetical protein
MRQSPPGTVVSTAVALMFVVPLVASMSRGPAVSGAVESMRAELARLDRDVSELTGELATQEAPAIREVIKRAERALDSSRLYLALDELQRPFVSARSIRYAVTHSAIQTSRQFEDQWRKLGEPSATKTPDAAAPIVVEAIAVAAASRAPATWRASRPYAEDAGMLYGLYYLGESQALSEFADFALSLPFGRPARSPELPALASEITAFEDEVAHAYGESPGDARRAFIPASVALKVARELDEKQQCAAALYQYLIARHRAGIATIGAPSVDVRARLDSVRAKLRDGRDHSIAELFLERAAAQLETGDTVAAIGATAIVDSVLPAYLRLVGHDSEDRQVGSLPRIACTRSRSRG